MPVTTLSILRKRFSQAEPYLMYGLTEAFRSCFLPPSEIDKRPESMGKAIPNADIRVINERGEECVPHESGELVHRGALVSMGYWNDRERTEERFRPAPCRRSELSTPEMAVWSGDIVRKDEEGFLYFMGRCDDMIKTSGYRVSPSEVEEAVYSSGLLSEAVAIGVAHSSLGQEIVVIGVSRYPEEADSKAVLKHCRQILPTYMSPSKVLFVDQIPRNPNGKMDRKQLVNDYPSLLEQQGGILA